MIRQLTLRIRRMLKFHRSLKQLKDDVAVEIDLEILTGELIVLAKVLKYNSSLQSLTLNAAERNIVGTKSFSIRCTL